MNIENNLISIQVDKEITNLFKYYLELIENLHLPKEQYDTLRTQILNHGNDSIRQLNTFLDFFDFQINKEKVEEAAKQKRQVFKKVIISPAIEII